MKKKHKHLAMLSWAVIIVQSFYRSAKSREIDSQRLWGRWYDAQLTSLRGTSKKRVGSGFRSRLFFLSTLVFLGIAESGFAKYSFDYNGEIKAAYRQIMDLDLPAAAKSLEALAVHQPDNLARIHLEDYYDFLQIYASDREDVYKSLKKNRNLRLHLLEEGPVESPWYLYTQADVRLHWAFLKFQFGDYLSGFLDVKKAFQLLEENVEAHPEFAPNYKDLGILKALVGTVPDQYQWGVRLLSGLEGSIAQGRKDLEKCLEDKQASTLFLQEESRLLYSYLLVYIGWDYQDAWRLLAPMAKTAGQQVFKAFIYSKVAFRSGNNDEAIRVLRIARRRSGWQYFPIMEFDLGSALLRKLDPAAAPHFRYFLERYQGRQDVKAAHHRLAWCALLNQDQQTYLFQMSLVQSKGTEASGRDKDASWAAQLDFVPHPQLLKARLLFDGGYFAQALQALEKVKKGALTQNYEQLELDYRKGRIYHGMKNWSKALFYYNAVYHRGAADGYFFACNAVLQMGLIFEERGQLEEAAIYFDRCLDADAEVYRNSLHMAAKAGLQRMKN
ncbi:MAG TPA: hypothetical protein VJ953_14890 [Saprospiraceae bacterium]|nr:hypothetical protein [Saprospiraceae bacterium]